jgi:hypothetical protein
VGLDFDSAWAGISRDIDELTMDTFGSVMLLSFCLLPVASLMLLVFRRWIAVLPLLGWLALLGAWFLYYATDWFSPVSGATASVVFLLVLLGWFMLIAAAFTTHRRRSDATTSSTT